MLDKFLTFLYLTGTGFMLVFFLGILEYLIDTYWIRRKK